MSYVVTVTFEVDPTRFEEFLPLIRANADTSLTEEPGCQQFDVSRDGTTVFLYEIYESPAAFQAHLAASHFKSFDAAVSDMVVSKDVRIFERELP